MTMSRGAGVSRRRLGTELAEALTTGAFGIVLISTWPVLIYRLGWTAGFWLGWLAAPIAATAAALLVLVWTVPLRDDAVLSLRVRRKKKRALSLVGGSGTTRSISVVMPVYNGKHYLMQSLPPLMALKAGGKIQDVVVVDDGSTDGSAAYARSLGARVMPSGGRRGPGAARNIAAAELHSEILWFVDADVVVHANAAERVRRAFADPSVVAVFGSYDDTPAAPNFGSQYKNLVHHHYHQHAGEDASTFWAGCGAVDRKAFLNAGGFDGDRYRAPAIEDVELGSRLLLRGSIKLDRELLSTHLKHWSVPELVRTDIFKRAVPWSRLMLQRSEVLDDLNVGTFERLRAVMAGLTVLAIAAAALGWLHPLWLIPILFTNLTGNWQIFRLFQRRKGLGFGVAALGFHQVYYLYSSATFALCWIEARVLRRNQMEPASAVAGDPTRTRSAG